MTGCGSKPADILIGLEAILELLLCMAKQKVKFEKGGINSVEKFSQ